MTPKGAEAIGASPDQAKMAGTGQQKEVALDLAQTQPQDTLQTAQRTEQPQTTPREAEKQERAERLTGQFGTLGTSVANLINGKVAEAEVLAGGSWKLATGITEGLDENQVTTLEAYAADPTNPELQKAAAAAMGISATDADIASKLGGYIEADNAAEILATQLPDTIIAKDVISELGMDDAEFEKLLKDFAEMGMTDLDLDTMTLQELQDNIEWGLQADFDEVSGLEAIATDVSASPAERQEARRALKAMGATGMYVTEAGVEDLTKQIDDADMITIGEEEISVEEMLSDEHISSIVGEYLDGDEDARLEIQEAYGEEFASWVESNEDALAAAAVDLDTSLDERTAEAESRNALTKTLGSDIIEAIFPGWDDFDGDLESAPAIIAMSLDGSLDEEDIALVRAELDGLTSEELANADWMKDEEQVEQFILWKNIARGRADPSEMYQLLLGPDMDLAATEELLAINSFLVKPDPALALLDRDGDGKLDDQATLLASYKKENKIGDMSAGDWTPPEMGTTSPTTVDKSLGKKLATVMQNFSSEQAQALYPTLSPENRAQLDKAVEAKSSELLKKARKSPSSGQTLKNLREYIDRIPQDNSELRKKLAADYDDVRREYRDLVSDKKDAKAEKRAKYRRKSQEGKRSKKSGARKLMESGVKALADIL